MALSSYKKLLKNNHLKIGIIITTAVTAISCSHSQVSQPKKDWYLIAGAAATGAAIGTATAPEFERPEQHALFWGLSLASAAALLIEVSNSLETQVAANRTLKKQVELESLLRPKNLKLVSEGVVEKGTSYSGFKIKTGAKYQLYETEEYYFYTPQKLRLIQRRMELQQD